MRNLRIGLRAVVCLAALMVALMGTRAWGQATSGVTGVVTDPSGGVVVGVDVTLFDANTGFTATTKTNDNGIYEFHEVPPDPNYVLMFKKDGFKNFQLQGVGLAVGTKETRDAKLEVGDTTTTIEVTTSGETTLNTTDASIGTVIDGTRVQDLPSLFVANAAALLQLAPGRASEYTATIRRQARLQEPVAIRRISRWTAWISMTTESDKRSSRSLTHLLIPFRN